MKQCHRIFLLFAVFFSFSVFADNLSPTEKNIHAIVLQQKKAQFELLQRMVNINSGTTNVAGVYRVGRIIQQQFNQLGFKTHWVNEPKAMHRAGTLIAERHGKKGKKLLLIGHLDTVFPANSTFQHLTSKEHSAKGPGVLDDKGGVVVILYALKALHAAHALDDTNITIVLTGDEEDSGKPTTISRQPLREAAREKEIALDFEPAITLETATIARRGIAMWTVESTGNESHSATIFQKDVGDGAIFELSRFLNTMRTDLEGEKYLSFNPGLIIGGTHIQYDQKTTQGTAFGKENVVSKTGLAKGDVRFINDEQKEAFKEKLQKLAKQSLPGTHSNVTFQDGIPAMQPTDNNKQLLEQYSAISVDLGLGAVKALDPGLRGAGDISYVASIVPANLAGLGPVGSGTHSVIERIEFDSLPVQTSRAAIFIYRLTQSMLE